MAYCSVMLCITNMLLDSELGELRQIYMTLLLLILGYPSLFRPFLTSIF